MSRAPAPHGRNTEILHAIVQSYIETGEPVASRSLAHRLRATLSPATIRNVMADLYDEGFLTQPHTSAGRIPTEKAFQSYVKALAAQKLLLGELQRLQKQFEPLDTVHDRVERCSRLLMEMTHGMGIAAAIPPAAQTLRHVDFVPLGDHHRVLIIVVTGDRAVHNKVVTLQEAIDAGELMTLRNYLNQHFAGWPLEKLREELERRLAAESAAYDAILKRLQVLYAKGLLDLESAPEVHVEGASNLVGLELHLTQEKLRDLFRALEQKKKILHILECFLEQPQGEVAVHVGLSDAHPSMGELSLIGIQVTFPNGLTGKVAVLGPMRMDYERCMSAVLHVAQALQNTATV